MDNTWLIESKCFVKGCPKVLLFSLLKGDERKHFPSRASARVAKDHCLWKGSSHDWLRFRYKRPVSARFLTYNYDIRAKLCTFAPTGYWVKEERVKFKRPFCAHRHTLRRKERAMISESLVEVYREAFVQHCLLSNRAFPFSHAGLTSDHYGFYYRGFKGVFSLPLLSELTGLYHHPLTTVVVDGNSCCEAIKRRKHASFNVWKFVVSLTKNATIFQCCKISPRKLHFSQQNLNISDWKFPWILLLISFKNQCNFKKILHK